MTCAHGGPGHYTLARMKNIVLLISGRGSNMEAIVNACAQEGWPARIAAVISNKATAGGLAFAAERGIPTAVVDHKQFDSREAFDAELARVLKPGGKLLVLEFSKVAKPLEKAYDWYSFNILPRIGSLVAGDADSYRYLAESIRMHPGQQELKALMQQAGFGHVDYHNMTAGVVALHVGIKC